tara:strand:- start:2548 stop:2658 length:111 start_codon:yes stop_codon:yes gene_type:complete
MLVIFSHGDFTSKLLPHLGRAISDGDEALRIVAERM